ncbi:MAG TPA: hypothetical protein G4O08_00130 [Anaerolineae bacterium]|nr:hypothetical protein [Anaerolineae bacterium]
MRKNKTNQPNRFLFLFPASIGLGTGIGAALHNIGVGMAIGSAMGVTLVLLFETLEQRKPSED